MSLYPYNPKLGQEQQTDVPGVRVDRGFVAHLHLSAAEAAVASTTGVHAAHTDTGEEVELTTGITNPPYPRNLTATAGGTATDVKAIQVIVEGTNILGEAITETLPAFTVNATGTVVGSKAFATVTKVTIPAHDGTGATTAIGFGDKVGLPDRLGDGGAVLGAALAGVREGTFPGVAVDGEHIESNTVDLSSALNGTAVDIYYIA